MGAALPESAQAVVERIFGVMDADRNGQVDLAEMTGLLKRQASSAAAAAAAAAAAQGTGADERSGGGGWWMEDQGTT
jgi:hypothetical protein